MNWQHAYPAAVKDDPTITASEPGFDIADLARQADVSSRTIRYYAELGLLAPSGRGPGGRRLYGPDALERLHFIARLKQLGLTLDEIGALNRSFDRGRTRAMLADLERMLDDRIAQVRERIGQLEALESELQAYRDRIRAKVEARG